MFILQTITPTPFPTPDRVDINNTANLLAGVLNKAIDAGFPGALVLCSGAIFLFAVALIVFAYFWRNRKGPEDTAFQYQKNNSQAMDAFSKLGNRQQDYMEKRDADHQKEMEVMLSNFNKERERWEEYQKTRDTKSDENFLNLTDAMHRVADETSKQTKVITENRDITEETVRKLMTDAAKVITDAKADLDAKITQTNQLLVDLQVTTLAIKGYQEQLLQEKEKRNTNTMTTILEVPANPTT